jgi:hypothetical protein
MEHRERVRATPTADVKASVRASSSDRHAHSASRVPRVARRASTADVPAPPVSDAGGVAERWPSATRIRRALGDSAPIGMGGGAVDRTTESRIAASSGVPLDEQTRHTMESVFGADFAAVRLHDGPNADDLNRALSARAFTVGSDIFVSADAPSVESAEGTRLLAHELTHVVQQGAGASRIVRRAVGFEFEDETWSVFQLQPGRTLRNPEVFNWSSGKVAAPGSEKEGEEEFTGKNVWSSGESGAHVNSILGQFNLRTAPKKGRLHSGTGYAIEPDGPYVVNSMADRMDLEFVTSPFPETPNGLVALDAALEDMRTVYQRIASGASGEWDGQNAPPFKDLIGPQQHGLSDKSIYLYGGTKRGSFKPQVTSGIALEALPEMMRTLGASPETGEERNEREQIRTMVYGAEGTPEKLEASATTRIIGAAPGLARQVVTNLADNHRIPDDPTGRDALVGFLSLALVYMVVLSISSKDGIKTQMPFLSRHSFVTLYRQIPAALRNNLATDHLLAEFEPPLKQGLRRFLSAKFPRESERQLVDERSSDGMNGQMVTAFIKETVDGNQQTATVLNTALGSFSRREWLTNVIAGRDLLKAQDLVAKLSSSDKEADRRAAAGYGKSIAIFQRGHANTKNIQPVGGEDPNSLALLENRNITSGPIDIDQASDLALVYFSWLRRLKETRAG